MLGGRIKGGGRRRRREGREGIEGGGGRVSSSSRFLFVSFLLSTFWVVSSFRLLRRREYIWRRKEKRGFKENF